MSNASMCNVTRRVPGGTVTLRSDDPNTAPVLKWNLCSVEADKESYREATRVMWDLYNSRAMKRINPSLVGFSKKMVADDAASIEEMLKGIIGQPTGSSRVVVERGPVSHFAEAVGFFSKIAHEDTPIRMQLSWRVISQGSGL